MLKAIYMDKESLLKIVVNERNLTKGKIRALGSSWRQRFPSPTTDEYELLNVNDGLVNPKILQTPIKTSLHRGHPGRDQRLRQKKQHLVVEIQPRYNST